MFVAAAHELEEEHRPHAGDRQVAELIDDQERREAEGLEALAEAPGGLRLLERRDEVGERAVVDAAAALRGGDRQTDGQDASMFVKPPRSPRGVERRGGPRSASSSA